MLSYKLGFISGWIIRLTITAYLIFDIINKINKGQSVVTDLICFLFMAFTAVVTNQIVSIRNSNEEIKWSTAYVVAFLEILLQQEQQKQQEEDEFEKLISTFRKTKQEKDLGETE
jgi:hypothetical protein